ncbi:MAG: ketoacyl-ACP synthase III [Alistipes sp.]|nr:ketoacyl-ACP synthase III [Alistipes sp.]MBP3473657.1 ketoacyl-ACP synthase III [Alistipes sp.]
MKIIGTGRAHPAKVVTNAMLETFLDTSDEWIRTRTGITERRLISSERLEDLATEAAMKAIEDAGLTPADIDYIICSNVVNEYITPSLSCIVQGAIGARCATVDVNAACSGFIYALDMADDRLKSGKAKNILVMAAEEPTRMVDWEDRSLCVLFGDGAGAVVVTEGEGLIGSRLTTMSKTDCLHYVRRLEPTPYITKDEPSGPMYMNGKEVFKTAVLSSSRDIKTLLDNAGLQPSDIKYYILHQANLRIIDAIANWLKLDMSHFPTNVERCGNTSSASVPMLLDELAREGKLQRGDKLLLSAFGAGFTTGACIIEWNK